MYPIPANATRIRYLESTGTQYVDTGLMMATNSVFSAVVAITASSTQFVFGQIGTSDNAFAVAAAASGKWIYDRRYNGSSRISSSSSVVLNTATTISATSNILTVDGVQNTGSALTVTPNNVNAYLFAWNRAFESAIGYGKVRIYSCQITASNGSRDFVPVRIGQTGYLFDRVSGQLFGNSGTGSFVLGPDTFAQGVVPTRMMAMGVRKKPTYLQANGIAYIDTGVPVSLNYAVRCKFQFVSIGTQDNPAPFGFWFRTSDGKEYSQRFYWHLNDRKLYVQTQGVGFNNRFEIVSGATENGVHECYIGFGSAMLDGVSASTGTQSWTDGTNHTQHLFGVYNKNPAAAQDGHYMQSSDSIIRIWSASWTDGNGNLVRDFVPAEQNGQAGMLDRVSNTFYGPASASTGAFSLGYD